MKMLKCLFVEMLGTFVILLIGLGAVAQAGALSDGAPAVAFGIAVCLMVCCLGQVSGAHFNPAISLGFVLLGKFPLRHFALYSIAQLLGACLSIWSLMLVFPDFASTGYGTSLNVGIPTGMGIEFLLTFILSFVVFSVSQLQVSNQIFTAALVGVCVYLLVLVGGPLTGASLNPARTLAPALISGQMSQVFFYFIGTFAGASAGALAARWLNPEESSPAIATR